MATVLNVMFLHVKTRLHRVFNPYATAQRSWADNTDMIWADGSDASFLEP